MSRTRTTNTSKGHRQPSKAAKRTMAGEDASCDEGVRRGAERRVLNALRRIVHAVDLHSRQLIQRCSVTAPQLVCLHTLAEEGTLTSRRLAEEVHVNPSTLVGILDRLERKGLVERQRGQRDRRSVFLSLTEQGRGFVQESPSPLQATLMVKLKQMEQAEQERLASTLEEVVELMEAQKVAAVPITSLQGVRS